MAKNTASKPLHNPNICRYLSDTGYCAFYDMQLFDRETIRCEGPGGWSDECWEKDTRGAIFDPETNRYYTAYEYAALLEDRVPGRITETEQDNIRNLRVIGKDEIQFLLMDRNAPKGND